MSITRQVAHNTIVQFTGKVIGAILALVTLGLMLRYLGQEGFGQYTTVISFLSVFSILADLGLYLVVTREISKKGVDESKIVSNAFTIKLFASIIILTLTPLIAMFFPYSQQIKLGIIVGAVSFLFTLLNQVLVGVFQKYFSMSKVAIGEIIGRIFWLLGVFIVIKLDLGLLWLLAAITLANFANFVVVFIFAKAYVKIKLSFDFDLWKYLLKIAAPLAFSVIFNLIYFKVDTVLLSVMKPIKDVGIYGAPFKVLESLITFAAIFAGLLLPVLSKYYVEDIKKFSGIFIKGFDVLSIFVIPLIVGTIFYARQIMVFFGGGEFSESANVLRILIFAVGAIFFSHLFGNTAIACNQQKKLMWIYISTALVSVILNLILIPKFTYYGAAISVTISEILVALFSLFVVYRVTYVFIKLRVFVKSLVAAVFMGMALYLLPDWYFLIKAALVIPLYFGILYLLKGFSKDIIFEVLNIKRG
jgi:O-antigen/teichoic acid export membrane protein